MSRARPALPFLSSAQIAFCVALASLGACQGDEPTYAIQIIGPPDAFVGATTVGLYANDVQISSSSVAGMGNFNLEVTGIDPGNYATGVIFKVLAQNDAKQLVAFGQSPLLEVRPTETALKIYVQKPGSIAHTIDLPVALHNPAVLAAEVPALATDAILTMTAPVFGLGRDANNLPSSALYLFNPLLYTTTTLPPARMPRADGLAFSRDDSGELFFFGGVELSAANPAGTITDSIEVLTVGRQNFSQFTTPAEADQLFPAVGAAARTGGAAIFTAGHYLVFGGADAAGAALNSVAVIDQSPDHSTTAVTTKHPAMAAARVGHTANLDLTTANRGLGEIAGRVLIYGGAGPNDPVAELLAEVNTDIPVLPKWLPISVPVGLPATDPLSARSHHQAVGVRSPEMVGEVLIIGGVDSGGNPRADSAVCVPSEARCVGGPITLKTARTDFTAFVIKDDLVIAGGLGPDHQPLATAEIYNVKTYAYVTTIPCVPRARASSVPLVSSVFILGGEGPGGVPSAALETYQATSP